MFTSNEHETRFDSRLEPTSYISVRFQPHPMFLKLKGLLVGFSRLLISTWGFNLTLSKQGYFVTPLPLPRCGSQPLIWRGYC